MKTETNGQGQESLASANGSPRLFEIAVVVIRHAVILATSEEDALQHVETWEEAWEEHSDLIDTTDREVTDIRDLKVDILDWDDEAHDATSEARKIIAERKVENDPDQRPGEQPKT